jgi:hypothetical protein
MNMDLHLNFSLEMIYISHNAQIIKIFTLNRKRLDPVFCIDDKIKFFSKEEITFLRKRILTTGDLKYYLIYEIFI